MAAEQVTLTADDLARIEEAAPLGAAAGDRYPDMSPIGRESAPPDTDGQKPSPGVEPRRSVDFGQRIGQRPEDVRTVRRWQLHDGQADPGLA